MVRGRAYAGPMDVEKLGQDVPISDALLSFHAEYEASLKRWTDASPEQRAEWLWEQAEKRKAERDKHAPEHNVAAGIARHFGWTDEYVLHLAQPYCGCEWDNDGAWNYCQHAYDLGLSR